MTKDLIFCAKIQNPQKGFKILSPNPNGVDFQDFLDPSIQSFQPLLLSMSRFLVSHPKVLPNLPSAENGTDHESKSFWRTVSR